MSSRQVSGPGRGCSRGVTWPTPATPTARPCPVCWTARPSLDVYVAEVEAGLAFMRRTGDEQTRRIARQLPAGWPVCCAARTPPRSEEAVPDRQVRRSTLALLHAHVTRAIAAAILGDLDGLARHTAAAMPLLPAGQGVYPAAVTQVLRGLALAGQARAGRGDERGDAAGRTGRADRGGWPPGRRTRRRTSRICCGCSRRSGPGRSATSAPPSSPSTPPAARPRRSAAVAPGPDHRTRRPLPPRPRRRTHRLHPARRSPPRVPRLGRDSESRPTGLGLPRPCDYEPTRPPGPATTIRRGPPATSTVTTGTIDLLGILSASQALSSETNIERLHARLVEVLSAMTGATGVHLLLWSDDRHDWLLPTRRRRHRPGQRHRPRTRRAAVRAAIRPADPRTPGRGRRHPRRPLRPRPLPHRPHLLLPAGRAHPQPRHAAGGAAAGEPPHPRRVHHRTARRVKLIAGQLAVSLDNAQLYAEYRRIADEQAALRRVATLVARGAPPGEVFAAVADEVARCSAPTSREHGPVRPGRRGDGRGSLERGHSAGLPAVARCASAGATWHAGVRDRPAGADRPLRRGRLGADRRPRPPVRHPLRGRRADQR